MSDAVITEATPFDQPLAQESDDILSTTEVTELNILSTTEITASIIGVATIKAVIARVSHVIKLSWNKETAWQNAFPAV